MTITTVETCNDQGKCILFRGHLGVHRDIHCCWENENPPPLCGETLGIYACELHKGHDGGHRNGFDGMWGVRPVQCGSMAGNMYCWLAAKHSGPHRGGDMSWSNEDEAMRNLTEAINRLAASMKE